jgi:hypothetical protein
MRQSTSQLAQSDRMALQRLKAEINAASEPNGDEAPSEKRKVQRRSRLRSPWTWGFGALAVLLIAVLAGGVLFYLSAPPDRSSPQATVTGYYAALQAQNYDLAWQYSAATYTNATSQASFIAGLRSDDAQLGRVVQVDASHMSVVKDNFGGATAQIYVTRADSSTAIPYTLTLSLYNGSLWLIANITSS